MRILICGGRDFDDVGRIKQDMLKLLEHGDNTIISGMAKGADMMGVLVARELDVFVEEYPANWDLYGKSAGFKRNMQMLTEGKPDLVLAYWNGESKGTAHTIENALDKKIHTHVKFY